MISLRKCVGLCLIVLAPCSFQARAERSACIGLERLLSASGRAGGLAELASGRR